MLLSPCQRLNFFFEIEANPAFLLILHTQNMTTWFYFRDVFYYVFVVPSCWVHKDAITISSRDETLKSQMRLRNPIFFDEKFDDFRKCNSTLFTYLIFFLWFQDEPFREWQDSREFDEKNSIFTHSTHLLCVRNERKKEENVENESEIDRLEVYNPFSHSSLVPTRHCAIRTLCSHPTNPFFHIAPTHSKRINADEHKNETIQHQYSASPPSFAASHTTHARRTRVYIAQRGMNVMCDG